jgi:hypothetical protein
MARQMTEWPSKRGPIAKIRPSDDCRKNSVFQAVDQWYDFQEFGYHLGNVGLIVASLGPRRSRHTFQERGNAMGAEARGETKEMKDEEYD